MGEEFEPGEIPAVEEVGAEAGTTAKIASDAMAALASNETTAGD